MAYSGDPAASNRDAVYFLVGDTDTTDHQLTDNEINYLLTLNGNVVLLAAADAAQALEAKFAKQVDKSVGDLKIALSDKAKHYAQLKKQLRNRATGMGDAASTVIPDGPWAGGISISEKRTDPDDSDMVQPRFVRGQHDHDTHHNERESEWLD